MIALAGNAYASILTELFTDASILKTGPKLPTRGILEAHQSKDQTGFRPGTGLEDTFLVFEAMCGKCLEWNAPLWFASLDLTKNFDRIEYDPVFLLQCWNKVFLSRIVFFSGLCIGKTGCLHDGSTLAIQSGVKQGDVISPYFVQRDLGISNAQVETEVAASWSVYRCV